MIVGTCTTSRFLCHTKTHDIQEVPFRGVQLVTTIITQHERIVWLIVMVKIDGGNCIFVVTANIICIVLMDISHKYDCVVMDRIVCRFIKSICIGNSITDCSKDFLLFAGDIVIGIVFVFFSASHIRYIVGCLHIGTVYHIGIGICYVCSLRPIRLNGNACYSGTSQ